VNEIIADWRQSGSPHLSSPRDLARYVVTTSGPFTVYFNPELEQLVVDDYRASGGYVHLYGEILNVGFSTIEVLDGYSSINIRSDFTYPMVLNTLNTGGVAGEVRITDLARLGPGGTPLTYVYRREYGVVVQRVYEGDTELWDLAQGFAAREASYSPVEGKRYVWVTGQEFTEIYKGTKTTSAWFEVFDPSTAHYDTWERIADTDERLLKDGEYSTIRTSPYHYTYEATEVELSQPERVDSQSQAHCSGIWVFGKCAGKVERTYTDTWKQGLIRYTTRSVKADYPLRISFIGYDQGDQLARIVVDHLGDLILAGTIENMAAGGVELYGRSITNASDRAVVRSPSAILLTAQGRLGDIGSASDPIRIDTAGGGGDSAWVDVSGRNVYVANINPTDGLKVFTASASGHLSLAAAGDILVDRRLDWTGLHARSIELVSTGGGIDVRIAAGERDTVAIRARAAGDISLEQAAGTMMISRIESATGDVNINVNFTGSLPVPEVWIVDGNTQTRQDERTVAELEELWKDLMLVGEAAERRNQQIVEAYVATKRTEYFRYWHLRGVQPVLDEQGRVVGHTVAPYDPATASEELRRLHELYGHTEYHPDWTYEISAAELEGLLPGNEWSVAGLTTGLPAAILFKQTGSTEVEVREPNIIGRNVTIHGLFVGKNANPIVIDGNDPTALRDETARLALLAAEAEDVGVDNETGLITVQQVRPLNVQASGTVRVVAGYNVYLSSRSPLYIDSVESLKGDSVRIKGTEGLYAADKDTVGPHVHGGRTVLEGGSGGIGTPERPLSVYAAGFSVPVTARADGDIYITAPAGTDLNVAEIFSRGSVNLSSDRSILDARGSRPIAIQGSSVNLVAGASVGASWSPLAVVATGDGLKVSARSGGVWVASPANLTVEIQAETDIEVSSASSVILKGVHSLVGNLVVTADQSIYVDPATAGLHASGRVLTLWAGAGSVGTGTNPVLHSAAVAVSAFAGTGVYLATEGGDDLTYATIATPGTVQLTAGGNILQMSWLNAGLYGKDIILRAGNSVGYDGISSQGWRPSIVTAGDRGSRLGSIPDLSGVAAARRRAGPAPEYRGRSRRGADRQSPGQQRVPEGRRRRAAVRIEPEFAGHYQHAGFDRAGGRRHRPEGQHVRPQERQPSPGRHAL